MLKANIVFVVSTFLIKLTCGQQLAQCDEGLHGPMVSTAKECGRAAKSSMGMRIVGGTKVAPHSLPWLVALMVDEDMHCGSSLITNVHLLSAGHCVMWTDFRTITAYVGLHDVQQKRNEVVQQRRIIDATIHEGFTSNKIRDDNDVALLKMEYPVVFNEFAVPICLPTAGEDFTGYMATIAGWGRIGEAAEASRYLLKTSQKILPDAECHKSKLGVHLTNTMMCGYSKGKDGCQGDSGGPLMILNRNGKFVQAGITSWGIGCGDPQYPGVYARVSKYVDWIQPRIYDSTMCAN